MSGIVLLKLGLSFVLIRNNNIPKQKLDDVTKKCLFTPQACAMVKQVNRGAVKCHLQASTGNTDPALSMRWMHGEKFTGH